MLERGKDGYEIVTSSKVDFEVRVYSGSMVAKIKFNKRVHSFRDVLNWINDHSSVLYPEAIQDTLALGTRMLTPADSNAARILSGEACIYVHRVAAQFGYTWFSFDDIYAQCPMLSETAVRNALTIGVQEGVFMSIKKDTWQLRRQTQLAELYESEQL